ncbi:MAG TPA: FAD-dependent oxidoreductase [Gemmatimonadaceae bacterium]
MSFFSSRLIGRHCVAHRTLAVVLERPAGFVFRAGQYIDITLPEPRFTDLLGPTRSFSIASAPSERDLLLVMRVRDSAFKRSLAEMPLGAPVLIDGPADDLALTLDDGRPAVFLAGGVGIAPFLSAVREAAFLATPIDATLFYSNRRPDDAAYLRELSLLTTRVAGFRCVPTMTRMASSAHRWSGESEHLGVPMLERHLATLRGPRYYLSGSTGFISGLCQEIERAGVPGSDIRIEMYTGY